MEPYNLLEYVYVANVLANSCCSERTLLLFNFKVYPYVFGVPEENIKINYQNLRFWGSICFVFKIL